MMVFFIVLYVRVLVHIALAIKKKGKAVLTYLSAKEPACAWLETELAFKKETLIMDLVKYLTFSMILFLLGIWGIFLNRKNILIMLMSIELMLLAVDLNFLVFSVYLDDMMDQLFALFVLTMAVAESAIGLAILVITFRICGTITMEFRATIRIAYSHCLAIWKLFAVLRYQPYNKPRETLFHVPSIELT
jgi:NADH:ubiquinone oxidoreductase subunit K